MRNHHNHTKSSRTGPKWPGYRGGILVLLLLVFGFAQAQPVLTASVTPVCVSNDGAVTLNLAGGVGGTYSYYLYNTYTGVSSPWQASSTFTGLGAGPYSAYVQGADSAYVTFVITRTVNATVQVTTATCPLQNGSIAVTATGGTGTYSYNWSNGGSGATLTGLASGRYQVTVSDGNGCTAPVIDTAVWRSSNLTANITSNGSACAPVLTATTTGATGAVSYLWSDMSTMPTLAVPTSGTYYVSVVDAGGCRGYGYITVTTGYVSLDTTVYLNPDCRGNSGAITVHAQNGVAPFSYIWSNGATTTAITGLGVGQYSVTVTDNAGCVGHDTYYLDQNNLLTYISGSNNTYCGAANASLTANAYYLNGTGTGGTPAYAYSWSNAATTSNLMGLAAGQYAVTVTDPANGCTATAAASISDTSTLGAYLYAHNPTCGASDGSISIAAYGGQPNYSVLWSNGATTDSITNLPAGTYTVVVTDVTGCSSTFSRTINGTVHLNVSLTTTTTSCDTALNTGTATAIVSGGTGPYTYQWYTLDYSTYHWRSIGTTQTITNLPEENVILIAADASGCISTTGDSGYIVRDPSCYDHITGYLYSDSTGDCTRDATEHGQSNGYVDADNGHGQIFWANPDASGYYDIAVLPGTYTLSAQLYNYSSCAASLCPANRSISFATSGLTSTGNDFGISPGATYDLGVYLGYTGSAPGGQRQYDITYYNYGLTTVPSGTVTFVHDANLVLNATTPAYTSYDATTHTVTWDVSNVTPYGGGFRLGLTLDIPSTVALGTLFPSHVDISPVSGDCNLANNSINAVDSAAASYDPNEKEVSPSGNLSADDTVLTYTVRFQNTGNAPATRVVIKDTLSSYVDVSSVRPGASSHPYKFSLSGNGILVFTFEPIYLPDSSHGDSSKGYVMYTVRTKKNLAIGSIVRNTANIYFDLNPAIVTNTTVSERSDYSTGIKPVNSGGTMSVVVSPNPVQDKSRLHVDGATGDVQFYLMDVRGQKVMETTTTNKDILLDSQMFANGMYLYTVKDALGNTQSGKVLIAR